MRCSDFTDLLISVRRIASCDGVGVCSGDSAVVGAASGNGAGIDTCTAPPRDGCGVCCWSCAATHCNGMVDYNLPICLCAPKPKGRSVLVRR